MRVFLASAYYNYRGTLVWMTPAMFLAHKLILPVGQVSFFSLIGRYGGSQPMAFYLVGNAMLLAATAATFISFMIGEERRSGMLPILTVAPANRLALLYGRAAGHFLEGVLWVVVAFAWAVLVFGLTVPPAALGGLFLTILVATAAAAGLGLLLGGLAYVSLDTATSANVTVFVLLLVSGANIPVEELPTWLHAIGRVLPITRSIEAARLLVDGAPFRDALPLLGADLLVGAAYSVAGIALFGWFQTMARRRGTLEGM